MKRKELEIILQKIPPVNDPRPELEQYSTPATLASDILFSAFMSGDIEDKVVADLGCGTGIFAIGAAILGAKEVHAFDIDENMLLQAQRNVEILLGEDALAIELKQSDIRDVQGVFDTVLMNPPFGAQNPGADLPFLLKSINTSKKIYTIHQTATLDFLRVRIQEYGGTILNETPANFPIPYQFSFHEKEMKLIDVTILTISGNE
jgi:putative methylase